MLLLTIQAGLRVSELTAINCGDIDLAAGAHVRVDGKGRKQRAVPLTKPVKQASPSGSPSAAANPTSPLFPTRTGRRLSRDAVERRVATHAATAMQRCASHDGKRIHPHVLRHSCAMSLLQAGVDSTVIALWVGHADVRSTKPYIHADMTIKERALALLTPPSAKPGRYTPSDAVLAYLDSLG
jgi:site-specific recombinase XerC